MSQSQCPGFFRSSWILWAQFNVVTCRLSAKSRTKCDWYLVTSRTNQIADNQRAGWSNHEHHAYSVGVRELTSKRRTPCFRLSMLHYVTYILHHAITISVRVYCVHDIIVMYVFMTCELNSLDLT